MLVLSRKVGQQVILPECQVTIQVLNVGRHQVRLGIVAPSTTQVHRTEVWQQIQVRRVAACNHAPLDATSTPQISAPAGRVVASNHPTKRT